MNERIEILENFFINETGYKTSDYVLNSLSVLALKFDNETITKAIEIVNEKYDVKTYNDFFALTHAICKNIYNEPKPLERG